MVKLVEIVEIIIKHTPLLTQIKWVGWKSTESISWEVVGSECAQSVFHMIMKKKRKGDMGRGLEVGRGVGGGN